MHALRLIIYAQPMARLAFESTLESSENVDRIFASSPNHLGSVELTRPSAEVYASARFILLMASSISCVLLNPIVAESTPAFRKANLIAFIRSSWLFWN